MKATYLPQRVQGYTLGDMGRNPLLPIRAPRGVHERLRRAAAEDGLTLADELTRLLDLRREFTRASLPRHPLARPAVATAVAAFVENRQPATAPTGFTLPIVPPQPQSFSASVETQQSQPDTGAS